MEITIDADQFRAVTRRFFGNVAPERALEAVNEIAKEFRKELVAASPVYRGRVSAQRRGRRLVRGRDYGPIKRAWSRRSAKRLGDVATVRNRAFYARMVEFGTARHPPRPFVAPVLARGGQIAARAVARVARKYALVDQLKTAPLRNVA